MPKGKETIEKQRQKRFCIEYLQDFNATQAAIRAGYSKRTARSIGSENLTKPFIQEEVSRQIQEILAKAKIPLEKQIFDHWMKRAFYDATEILDLEGKMKLTNEQLHEKGLHVCIDGITRKETAYGTVVIYKLADKEKAADMLQRYIQMIKEQPIKVEADSPLVDLTNLLLKQSKDPKNGEKIIAELEKLTGYEE